MKHTSIDRLPTEAVSHNAKIEKRVMLRAGDIPHVTNFSRAVFPPGEVAVAHSHDDMHEVFYVQTGHASMTVNGAAFPIQEGDCIHVSPGDSHEIANTGDGELVLCYFGIED